MANAFPVRFPDQLRQHLRALRKERGLTQAQLGALVGVSQARIAEIEANPGLVNFEQLMKLLSVLGATLTLHEGPSTPALNRPPNAEASPPATPVVKKNAAGKNSLPTSAARRSLVVRPKKGSW